MNLLPSQTLTTIDAVHHTDLFTLCNALPSGSVDAIITDLPYEQTGLKWDAVIPFTPMWAAFKRVIKKNGAIMTTATQPFSSALVMSNPEWFHYEWVWNKKSPVDFLNAKKRPMAVHETVQVFCEGWPTYNPQFRKDVTVPFGKISKRKHSFYGDSNEVVNYGVGYPLSIIAFPRPNNLLDGGLHPTQKPVDLFRYLIRTYTQPGELILDPTCGSGTTAIAAREEGRHFICGDSSLEYVALARKRLAQPYTLPMFAGVTA